MCGRSTMTSPGSPGRCGPASGDPRHVRTRAGVGGHDEVGGAGAASGAPGRDAGGQALGKERAPRAEPADGYLELPESVLPRREPQGRRRSRPATPRPAAARGVVARAPKGSSGSTDPRSGPVPPAIVKRARPGSINVAQRSASNS